METFNSPHIIISTPNTPPPHSTKLHHTQCGYAVVLAIFTAVGVRIDTPLPPGVQMDWEAILRPTPEVRVKKWATPDPDSYQTRTQTQTGNPHPDPDPTRPGP